MQWRLIHLLVAPGMPLDVGFFATVRAIIQKKMGEKGQRNSILSSYTVGRLPNEATQHCFKTII